MYFTPLGQISTAVSCDYTSLKSPNNGKNGNGLSWIMFCWLCVKVNYQFFLTNEWLLLIILGILQLNKCKEARVELMTQDKNRKLEFSFRKYKDQYSYFKGSIKLKKELLYKN